MQRYAIIQRLELMAARRKIRPVRKKENLEIPVEERKDSINPFFKLLRKPKVFIPFIIVIVFGLLFYFRGLFIVALVNGQPISRIAVIQTLEKRDGKQAVSSLITQTLILQEAQKKNVDVSQGELDEMAKKLEDGLKKQGQNLDQALSIQGMTRADLETQLRIRKLIEKMVALDVKATTDKEVNDYIEKSKASIPEDLKPDEVKKTAREQLEQQKIATKAQAFIENLQSKAKINYFVNY